MNVPPTVHLYITRVRQHYTTTSLRLSLKLTHVLRLFIAPAAPFA